LSQFRRTELRIRLIAAETTRPDRRWQLRLTLRVDGHVFDANCAVDLSASV
jgi:hypothetical protein